MPQSKRRCLECGVAVKSPRYLCQKCLDSAIVEEMKSD